jgi:hypothetical protein
MHFTLKLAGIAVCCLLLTAQTACKKTKEKKTSCAGTLYGYKAHTAPYGSGSYFDTSATATVINPTTLAGPSFGTFFTSSYEKQAAFNASDNCYYTLRTAYGWGTGMGTMYKTSISGTVTTLSGPATPIWAITYNKVNNKLYCIAGTQLAEIIVSGLTYSLSPVVTPTHPFFQAYAGDNTTVDDNTGALYFTTGDTTSVYIEKFVPGSSATTVVAHITGCWVVLGVRHNSSDNMLYAMKEIYPTTGPGFPIDFIKIDPATGTETMVSHLGFDVNHEFYSACIDPCSNRYLVSTMLLPYTTTAAADTFLFNQLDMSGTVVQHNITTGYYQGLYVNY